MSVTHSNKEGILKDNTRLKNFDEYPSIKKRMMIESININSLFESLIPS